MLPRSGLPSAQHENHFDHVQFPRQSILWPAPDDRGRTHSAGSPIRCEENKARRVVDALRAAGMT